MQRICKGYLITLIAKIGQISGLLLILYCMVSTKGQIFKCISAFTPKMLLVLSFNTGTHQIAIGAILYHEFTTNTKCNLKCNKIGSVG